MSARGDYLLSAAITGGPAVRAWSLDRSGANGRPLVAGVQLTDPLGLAISPDGRLVLATDSSTGLWVAPVNRTDRLPAVPATRIAGLSGVAAMEFTGPARAVAAAHNELVFLRFGGLGRGSASVALFPRGIGGVPEYAVDYRNSRMAVSPDGSRLAVLELESAELEVVPLPGRDWHTYIGPQNTPTERVSLGVSVAGRRRVSPPAYAPTAASHACRMAQPAAGSLSSRSAPNRHAMRIATAVTATMIVEIALISGVTPNLTRP